MANQKEFFRDDFKGDKTFLLIVIDSMNRQIGSWRQIPNAFPHLMWKLTLQNNKYKVMRNSSCIFSWDAKVDIWKGKKKSNGKIFRHFPMWNKVGNMRQIRSQWKIHHTFPHVMWKCKHKDQYEYDEKALINWKAQFYNFWNNYKWWKSLCFIYIK